MQENELNDSKMDSHYRSYICAKVLKFKALVERTHKHYLDPQDTNGKVFKSNYLKCPHMIHLNLKCISYDQKKGQDSNWEFDS